MVGTNATAGYWQLGGGVALGAYHRVYIRVSAFPATTARTLLGIRANGVNIRLNPNGTLEYFEGGTSYGTSADALQANTWHRVEWRDGTGSSVPVLLIDGVTQVTASPSVWTWNGRFGCASDTVADTYTVYFDDYANDDAAFPGPGRVVLLVPTSDSVRDTLWTGGVGGTTNLWDAVDNRPPAGTATETNTSQIEHAGGAAGTTDDYEANMTTYTAAGVGANDTVLFVHPFGIDGEDVATGTKKVAYEVLSNPAIAISSSFNAGDDIGALGTYPTNWAIHFGNKASNPTVTKGTAPVMRVRRPETATRVASVCFMGMYVEYLPALAPPPFRRPWRRWPKRSMR
jgi:hypothetical protein